LPKKGPRKHLKRLAVPRDWRIPRGRYSWAVRPRSGPHPMNSSIPLLNLVREMLAPAYTAREAIHVLFEGKVLVDGIKRQDHKFPVGLMDVISIPSTDKFFRILPLPKRGLDLHPIGKKETGFKLCNVVNKVSVRGDNLQLNLHDGRNIMINKAQPEEELLKVKTHDTLKIEIPNQKVVDVVPYKTGTLVLISGGKNVGLIGRVQEIHKPKGTNLRTNVSLKIDEATTIEVPIDYTFAIGKEEPIISFPTPVNEQTDRQNKQDST
jgi:small subunit ribosomal protein S4e